MQKIVIKTISTDSAYYPAEFTDLEKPVKQFYAAGNLDLLKHKPRLGIVGTRAATAYGKAVTTDMARSAAIRGATVISGMALGIDSIAHRAALRAGGSTIAVLPSSLEKVYPASHYHLAKEILAKQGLLISEYTGAERPMRHHFIERNRLIAALSDVLLVTEASAKSGTRHTVDSAIQTGRKVGVVPGNIDSPQSEGANLYIRDGGIDIHPITSTNDLLYLLGLNEKPVASRKDGDNEYEQAIIASLMQRSSSVNFLIQTTQLPVSTLNVHLTMLELKGVIEQVAGRWKLI